MWQVANVRKNIYSQLLTFSQLIKNEWRVITRCRVMQESVVWRERANFVLARGKNSKFIMQQGGWKIYTVKNVNMPKIIHKSW